MKTKINILTVLSWSYTRRWRELRQGEESPPEGRRFFAALSVKDESKLCKLRFIRLLAYSNTSHK